MTAIGGAGYCEHILLMEQSLLQVLQALPDRGRRIPDRSLVNGVQRGHSLFDDRRHNSLMPLLLLLITTLLDIVYLL